MWVLIIATCLNLEPCDIKEISYPTLEACEAAMDERKEHALMCVRRGNDYGGQFRTMGIIGTPSPV